MRKANTDLTGQMPRLISESSLGAHAILLVLSWGAHIIAGNQVKDNQFDGHQLR